MSKEIVQAEFLQKIPVENDFSYDGFQVVRGEFFSHLFEPSITFKQDSFYVNSACIKRLPDVSHILILVNEEEKKLVIRPCSEDTKDCQQWKTKSNKPKTMKCRYFFQRIMVMMNWNENYRYKVLGKIIKANGEIIIVFNLASREEYPRKVTEENKVINARRPLFPAEWENQFGLSVEEHSKQMEIDIVKGFSVIRFTDKPSSLESTENEQSDTDN